MATRSVPDWGRHADTFASSHLPAGCHVPGSAAATVGQQNSEVQRHHLRCWLCAGGYHDVGRLHGEGTNGRRIAAVMHTPRSAAFLHERISVTEQRGSAFCILETYKSSRRFLDCSRWTIRVTSTFIWLYYYCCYYVYNNNNNNKIEPLIKITFSDSIAICMARDAPFDVPMTPIPDFVTLGCRDSQSTASCMRQVSKFSFTV